MSVRERGFLAVLAIVAAYFLIWPLWRAFFPLEIFPTEGWNAYHQDAAFSALLYPPSDALVVNNYPPLSFYVVAVSAWLLGDPLYIGRALSILATLGIGIAVAAVVRQFGGSRVAAAIAGLWLVATMVRSLNRYVGANDPHLVGQFIMVTAFAWFWRRDHERRSVEPAILLMVVAGFWKHNIVAIPTTVFIWLALRDGRLAIRPIAVGVCAGILGLALCVAIYGEPFISNMLTPRSYSLLRVGKSLGRLQWVAPALVLWAIWAWSERQHWLARLTALQVGLALFSYLVQWSGEAVVDNAQSDLVVAVAIGLGIAYDRIGAIGLAARYGVTRARTAMIAILVVRLVATGRIEPALILFDDQYRASFFAHTAIARHEALRIADISGAAGCDNKVVCRMAGKPFVLDDFKAEQLVATGMLGWDELAQLLRRRGITLVHVDNRTFVESLHRDIFAR